MKGNDKVIQELNARTKDELLAIHEYFLQHEMMRNWGYKRLSDAIRKQAIQEMHHAEMLVERTIFLDAIPDVTGPMQLAPGRNVKEQLEPELKLEHEAVAAYNHSAAVAREAGDNTSRDLFEQILGDQEEHVDWLEAQLQQIADMGYERYLAEQLQ